MRGNCGVIHNAILACGFRFIKFIGRGIRGVKISQRPGLKMEFSYAITYLVNS